MYITTEEGLGELCETLKSCKWLAIDTEFVREKSYFPYLGLVQIAGNGVCAAVDPIAIKNLDPLLELIQNSQTLKVFHAGKQDLEIFYRLCGEAIKPVFDTQIAASLVGWGAQISFAKIVLKVTGKKMHKSETYSDWCRRPLSKSQIEYALDDVRYLVPVYEKLLERLEKKQRLDWVHKEFHELEDPEKYQLPDPRRQFLKIKNSRSLKPKNLSVLIEVTAWRENEARKRNCLARAVLRDEPLLEIARRLPKNQEDFGDIRGFHPREISRSGAQVLDAIKKGLAVPESSIEKIPEVKTYSPPPGVEELLASHVQRRSVELKIEPFMLADRKQIRDFVRCHDEKVLNESSLFHGWRKDLIGAELLDILDGKLGLSIGKNGQIRKIDLPE